MLSPKKCWPYLAEKAEETVRQWQTAIARTQQQLTTLRASRQRLQVLYEEYRQRENSPETTGLGMAAAMNQRQFMGQLLGLQQRADLDIRHAETALAQQQKALIAAQVELRKMEMLVEQEKLRIAKEAQRREQRQLDDFGVMHFNLRRSV